MKYTKDQINAVVTLKKAGMKHRDIAEQVFGKRSMASSVFYILYDNLYTVKEGPQEPKIFIFDIETAPEIAYVWGRWKNNVGVSQVVQRSYMLCWAGKWLGEEGVTYDSQMQQGKEGTPDDSDIVLSLWTYLDAADVVVAHNGIKFDLAYAYSRFAYHGLGMPSPFKVVDTLKVAKKYFRFPANSLAELAEYFGVKQGKLSTDFSLWAGCMNGDIEAWEKMLDYNIRDVDVLESIYLKLRDYDKSHPNLGLYYDDDKLRDPVTGSEKVRDTGKFAYTNQSVFPVFEGPTGHMFRSTKKVKSVKYVNTQ